MPATLDPATALILIDLQHGITALPAVDPSDQIVARGARLAEAFRAHKKLVAATRVAFSADGGDVIKTRTAAMGASPTSPPDWGDIHTELNLGDDDIPITKRGWNAFYRTELDLELRPRGAVTRRGIRDTGGRAGATGHDQRS
jgi:nicotinamidase-related amidase